MTRTNTTPRTGDAVFDLPVRARLRLEHAGRWVAWAEDGGWIIASADDYEAVRLESRCAGVERAACEWLPPLDEARSSGGVSPGASRV